MPHWVLISLLGPILWAIVNHLDKYAITKYKQIIGIEGIVILMNILSIVILPIAFFSNDGVLNILLLHKLILILNGFMCTAAGLCYLYAIAEDEASVVAPLFQLIPIFGFFLGYFFLRETLSVKQIFGSVIVIFGVVLLLIDFNKDTKVKFKFIVGILMVISSLLFASFQIFFKMIALKETFWISTFWQYVGIFLSGLVLLFIKKFRDNFLKIFSLRKFHFIGVVGLIEILNMGGNLATAYALLLAPVALVLLMSSYQPLFVLFFGFVITYFFPFLGKETLDRRKIAQKFISITIILFGTYILYAT